MNSFSCFRSVLAVCFRRSKSRLLPKLFRDRQRVDIELAPPDALVSSAMKLAVVMPAQGHRVFIAHLSSHGRLLSEFEMVCVRGLSATNDARLGADKFQVLAIPPAQRFA